MRDDQRERSWIRGSGNVFPAAALQYLYEYDVPAQALFYTADLPEDAIYRGKESYRI